MMKASLVAIAASNCTKVQKFNYWRCMCTAVQNFSTNQRNINTSENWSSEEKKISQLLEGAANFNEATDTAWSTTPYPGTAILPSEVPSRPKQDPLETSIFLFPGQGIIKVGQIRKYLKYPRVNELFNIANEVLNYNVRDLCLKGPQDTLNRTEFNQLATVITSLAALEKLWEETPKAIDTCKAVAGYSVGEITALIFSGALSVEDGIRLAAVRGAAMQHASDLQPQGMLSVFCTAQAKIGPSLDEACKWATDMGVSEAMCKVAIYLYPEVKIFAGHDKALSFIEKNGRSMGFRKIQRLPVSGAFHTPLMQPAIKSFRKALDKVTIEEPRVNVYSNCTGKIYESPNHIRKMLIKHLVMPVKWEQILHTLYTRPQGENFPQTFDVGSEGLLTSVLSKLNKKASEMSTKI